MLNLAQQTLSQAFNIKSLMRGRGNNTAKLAVYLQDRNAGQSKTNNNRLVALVGLQKRATLITLEGRMEVEIGRGDKYGLDANKTRCEVCNPYLSARHALLGIDACGPYIMDVGTNGNGSKNGTFLNGERLAANVKSYLMVGDRVSFGLPGCATAEQMVILQPLA